MKYECQMKFDFFSKRSKCDNVERKFKNEAELTDQQNEAHARYKPLLANNDLIFWLLLC
jgi:hypothetical protein